MKKLIFALCALFFSAQLLAQSNATKLSAVFNYNTFYIPQSEQNYVETYLSIDAWNMTFTPTSDGKYKAAAHIVLTVKNGDSVVYAKQYTLNSPAIENPNACDFNFVDLQRFSLPNGIYTLEMTVKDVATNDTPSPVVQKIILNYNKKTPALTKPLMIASVKKSASENPFSRNGYDMEPYPSNFFPEQIAQMNYYVELYNIQREIGSKPFLVYSYIEDNETGHKITDLQQVKRHESSPYIPILASFDISNLPSGNYNLVVEVHNKDNENLLYQKTNFYRSNPKINIASDVSPYASTFAAEITDENLLNYYLKALYPIASPQEIDVINDIVKRVNLEEKQAFFYKFWVAREQLKPEEKWREYRGWLEYVDKNFSYPKTPGYRTDRGRVYLQYGPPDFIRDEKNFVGALHLSSGGSIDPQLSAVRITQRNESLGHIYYLPYQLWRYNKLDRDDPNRVFLFWDELRSGFYKLLVSNARGEVQDPLWERRLSQQQLEEYVVGEVGEQFKRGY